MAPPDCGFFGTGPKLTKSDLGAAIAAAAQVERANWFAGGAAQKEHAPARFGTLVRYWLAGNIGHGNVRPDALVATQQGAFDPAVKYADLLTTKLLTEVQKFAVKESAVLKSEADLIAAWGELDIAHAAVKAAKDSRKVAAQSVADARREVKVRRGAVRAAEGDVAKGTVAQPDLNLARNAHATAVSKLAVAKTNLTAAEQQLGAAKKSVVTAERKVQAARTALSTVRRERDKQGKEASALDGTILNRVRAQLIAARRPATAPVIPVKQAAAALVAAHRSRADIEAWSGAFVVACVRGVAIDKRLEAIAGGDHVGADALLRTSSRHSDYVIEARKREKKGQGGTYHAFDPDKRSVEIGDIIAMDRTFELRGRAVTLKSLKCVRNPTTGKVEGCPPLHCDIVTKIVVEGGRRFAETIGGNVNHTVRRRRYPIDSNNLLIVKRDEPFLQENDAGTQFVASVQPTPGSSRIASSSTARVFALLKLVEECRPAQDPELPWSETSYDQLLDEVRRPSPWRHPTGNQRLMPNTYTQLESPFLDEEMFTGERRPIDGAERNVETSYEQPADDEGEAFQPAELEDESAEILAEDGVAPDEAREDESEDLESWDLEAWDLESAEGVGEHEAAFEVETERDEEPDFEEEWRDLAPADSVNDAVAQVPFAPAVRDRLGALLDAKRTRAASKWNAVRHPGKSGVDAAALLARLDRYVDRAAVEGAMQADANLRDLAGDQNAVLAVVAHQFQQKIYAAAKARDGMIGEGTLDALGFVRHRGAGLNPADSLNVKFHVKGKTKAYRRLEKAYKDDPGAFTALGSDVTPKNWYYLFVNAPFLGRPFKKGVHIELMRRLRLAERWLLGRPQYRGMSAVELGAALGIDEDHAGGRSTKGTSMHTLGLAVDIGYIKNPWVAGQHGTGGKPNTGRNDAFKGVTRNVARLLTGRDETLTPQWLSALGADPGRTTESAFNEIQARHARLLEYLGLESKPDRLRAVIEERSRGSKPELVIGRNEKIETAVTRWRRIIRTDRGRFARAVGSNRQATAGFVNLHRDLVVALRDHGCLAWGAIDLGPRASGDMMHFDCRATGIGWTLSLDIQRTVGPGHPCRARPSPTQELEQPRTTATTAAATGFLGGLLWTFAAKALPVKVGVFCPRAVTPSKPVELLVFAHGLLSPCKPVPTKVPRDLITNAPFRLAKLVDASNRAIVLVVPFMDWSNVYKGKLGFGRRNRQHVLGKPANLNGVLDEVLAEIGRVHGTPAPTLKNLVIAGHSRAFDFLDPLARAHADPEMSSGALRRLSQVWAFDTTYTAPVDDWTAWITAKPALEIEVFYRHVGSTKAGGIAFERAVAHAGGRLRVTRVDEGHCAVPGRRLPAVLAGAAVSTTPEITHELDADEAFHGDEEELVWEEAGTVEQELEEDEFEDDELEDESDGEGLDDTELGYEDSFEDAAHEHEESDQEEFEEDEGLAETEAFGAMPEWLAEKED